MKDQGKMGRTAVCHWLLGRRSEAQQLVEAALQQDPDEFHALALLAQMNLARDRPAEALPNLERIVKLRPHDFRRRDQLAQTYRRLGDLARASEQEGLRDQIIATRTRLTELSKQALESPLDDTLRCELAGVYLELGRPREAEFWFKAALHGNPGNETARHALQQLNWLGDPESPNVMRHVPR